MAKQNANNANNTAAMVAAYTANGGAVTVVPTATAFGGNSKQQRTKAPKAAAATAPVSLAKPQTTAAATTVATQAAAAATAVVQAATQAAQVQLPKAHSAKQHTAKPTAKSLTRIVWLSPTTPPRGMRPKLWGNYAVGITLLHAKVAVGLCPLQVMFYVQHGYAKVRPCTDVELQQAVAAWQQGTLTQWLAAQVGTA